MDKDPYQISTYWLIDYDYTVNTKHIYETRNVGNARNGIQSSDSIYFFFLILNKYYKQITFKKPLKPAYLNKKCTVSTNKNLS